MTSEFKLTDAFFKDFRFKILRTTVPLLLVAVSVGWYIAGASVEPFNLIGFGIVLAVVLPFSIGRSLKRQIQSFRTFKIELTDDRITREQDGLRRLEIPFSDIVSIHDVAGKALAIRGKGPHQVLSLPATLEGYEELRARLAQIRPIEARPEKAAVLRLVAGSLVPLVFMVALYRSQSVPVVMVSGSLLIGTLVYCGVVIFRSPHLDRRVKRSSWALVLVLFSVIAKMWFTLAHR